MSLETAITIILSVLGLLIAVLSWIWRRHIKDDEKRHADNEKRHAATKGHIDNLDARLDRALARVADAVESIRNYQTDFNLKVHADLAAIKAWLERKA